MQPHPRIIWLDSVDSTNNELARHIADLDNLSVVAAREQTAGRGQGDHKWSSVPGENLTFSVLLKFPPMEPVEPSQLLLLTQMITCAIREYLLEKGVDTRIKWHNDIYAGDRKICGILIENTFEGASLRSCIAGVGLNINQAVFPEDLPNPVSLSMLTGLKYDVGRELEMVAGHIEKSAGLLQSARGRIYLDAYFREHCFNLPEALR